MPQSTKLLHCRSNRNSWMASFPVSPCSFFWVSWFHDGSWDDRSQNTWASKILDAWRLDRCELNEPASPSLGFQGCHCHPWKICTFVLRYRLGISQKSFCPSHWGGLKANPVHFFRITIASLHGSRIQRAIKAFTSWNSDWIVSKSLTRHFSKSHDPWKNTGHTM